jgi:hypothetical protein
MKGLWQSPVRAARGAGEEGTAPEKRTLQHLWARLRSIVRARRTAPKAQGEQRRKVQAQHQQERLGPARITIMAVLLEMATAVAM